MALQLIRCPVCEGRGSVPVNFYSRMVDATSTNPVPCWSCQNGIIMFDPDAIPQQASQLGTGTAGSETPKATPSEGAATITPDKGWDALALEPTIPGIRASLRSGTQTEDAGRAAKRCGCALTTRVFLRELKSSPELIAECGGCGALTWFVKIPVRGAEPDTSTFQRPGSGSSAASTTGAREGLATGSPSRSSDPESDTRAMSSEERERAEG